MTQSATPSRPTSTPHAELRARLIDWSKTAAVALMVFPFPAALLWAAFTMPGMP